MRHPEPTEPRWTFLSNHAHVLVCITEDSEITIRHLSDRVGITERAIQRILSDLQQAGYVDRRRSGRRNVYVVDGDLPLRHPLEAHQSIGALIALITGRRAPARKPTVPPQETSSGRRPQRAVPRAKAASPR